MLPSLCRMSSWRKTMLDEKTAKARLAACKRIREMVGLSEVEKFKRVKASREKPQTPAPTPEAEA